jgi:hypothetical protein
MHSSSNVIFETLADPTTRRAILERLERVVAGLA